MPKKINPDGKYGQNIIALFAKLLFSKERHSLIELSRMLQCSKQTTSRMIDDITMFYGVRLTESFEGKRKYYQIEQKPGAMPLVSMSESEFNVLQMCRAFTEHLLGRQLFGEAAHALMKSQALLPDGNTASEKHFASLIPGNIDYTPHHQIIRTLIHAMDEKKVCCITYLSIMAQEAKTFYLKPLKIFSHKDTIYLHARMAKFPGKTYKEPKFDPLLAIHRIKTLEVTERTFEFPENYDFEKIFNQNFGVIKEAAFGVVVEFSGYAAKYVSERNWSPDQALTELPGGKIRISFTASSIPELVSWVLSFGDEARLLDPDWLVKDLSAVIKKMAGQYIPATTGKRKSDSNQS
jgi:predicted DNA-binding transcriptional regulator YafY